MLGVYKINFYKSVIYLNEDYEKFSDIDKEKIADIQAWSFIEYEEDKKYAIFLIIEPQELKRYIEILGDNLIQFRVEEVSREILKNTFIVEDYILSNNSLFNKTKYKNFVEDLNMWIYDNLNIDIVLDRISLVGINKLTKIEKEFLDNYN